ncbi:MAG TPA: hypothetical protein VGT40_15910 [Methylomirabilota bacterium]|jgi:hypothetical protein|nr:hypothetical protein [Methylomirabilota bacterium]
MKANKGKAKGKKVTVRDLKPRKAAEVKGGAINRGGDCAATSDTNMMGCPS